MKDNRKIFLHQMKALCSAERGRLDDIVSRLRLPFQLPNGQSNVQELEEERIDAAATIAYLERLIEDVESNGI